MVKVPRRHKNGKAHPPTPAPEPPPDPPDPPEPPAGLPRCPVDELEPS